MSSPAGRTLAAWALASELGDAWERDDLHAAAERTCRKLSARLSMLVSVEGYRALLARAVDLAAPEYPFLDRLKGPSANGACLGEPPPPHGIDPSTMREGLTAVLAGTLELFFTFIGQDLTVRAVHDVWPDAPVIGAGAAVQETHT